MFQKNKILNEQHSDFSFGIFGFEVYLTSCLFRISSFGFSKLRFGVIKNADYKI